MTSKSEESSKKEVVKEGEVNVNELKKDYRKLLDDNHTEIRTTKISQMFKDYFADDLKKLKEIAGTEDEESKRKEIVSSVLSRFSEKFPYIGKYEKLMFYYLYSEPLPQVKEKEEEEEEGEEDTSHATYSPLEKFLRLKDSSGLINKIECAMETFHPEELVSCTEGDLQKVVASCIVADSFYRKESICVINELNLLRNEVKSDRKVSDLASLRNLNFADVTIVTLGEVYVIELKYVRIRNIDEQDLFREINLTYKVMKETKKDYELKMNSYLFVNKWNRIPNWRTSKIQIYKDKFSNFDDYLLKFRSMHNKKQITVAEQCLGYKRLIRHQYGYRPKELNLLSFFEELKIDPESIHCIVGVGIVNKMHLQFV